MSTLHDGSLVRQQIGKLGQFKDGNSGVPIYLVIYLGRAIIVTKFHKNLTDTV